MIHKIIFLTLFFFSFSNAGMEEVRIGVIDDYYSDKINKKELKQILIEIETQFETQIGFDVFNYSLSGKPIDIVYMRPLALEKKILRKTAKRNQKKEKIDSLKNVFSDKQRRIKEYEKNLKKFASHINEMTKSLNRYVVKANKRKDFTTAEYKNTQMYVERKQKRINREIVNLRKERRVLRRMLDKYNKKIYAMNKLVSDHNRLNNQIMRMSKRVKKVKGRTFGLQEINLKTYYKDGKKVKEKSVKNSMTKIEIYGFESKEQLKVLLAHEIGHLVGIPHINIKGALMNPFLQENQIGNLVLLQSDIRNFRENF